ncbi:MAG: dephospho-CoA kinase, partial [Verrucomicrobiaceae bacterium]
MRPDVRFVDLIPADRFRSRPVAQVPSMAVFFLSWTCLANKPVSGLKPINHDGRGSNPPPVFVFPGWWIPPSFLAPGRPTPDSFPMQVMALTGGIASGKTMTCALLREYLPSLEIFDSDTSVRDLLVNDVAVAEAISAAFGEEVVEGGRIDRAKLRAKVFSDEGARAVLEAILHPRVREECLDSLRTADKKGVEFFVADVPLLYEKGFDFGQSQVLVVASSRSTQFRRIKTRNGFEDLMIDSILAAQLPVQEKI